LASARTITCWRDEPSTLKLLATKQLKQKLKERYRDSLEEERTYREERVISTEPTERLLCPSQMLTSRSNVVDEEGTKALPPTDTTVFACKIRERRFYMHQN